MEPTFFATPADFRKWLEHHHQTETELLVGFYKVDSGKPSITWSESVDQALCFGWIDGVRKSLGKESYTIRFTPRRPSSIWSGINIKKVEELTKQGLMQSAGLAAFEKRTEAKSRIYSFEKDPVDLSAEFEKKFKANSKAWDYFQSQAPGYKKQVTHWVMDAKQEATKLKRLETLIAKSATGERR
ncbi:YdeI/OmpD-associated family protein [Solitalea sp. MAHUQ-68]|uniref:YdeI/OmpD-associated family protein n=1 Tax=Solitalea agri TaxID=2953739 RepID=A0A9X2EZ09_9SPHI|nr:YdeI/OmpD-associated family protein [Solitalea agri]MCO4291647.1 YdeI/OmpD-associated family protein [Solitalea agri]